MSSVRHCIRVAVVVLGLATAAIVRASDVACATDKLRDEHFQERLSRDHDGVVVRLDMDPDVYLKSASDDAALSDARRDELLREGAARPLEAKRALLQGSPFSIHHNQEFGAEVVVLVDGMSDVCELAADPHVSGIWVNSRWKVESLRPVTSADQATIRSTTGSPLDAGLPPR